MSHPTQMPWLPPERPPPAPLGWYVAADGRWYQTDTPPGPGWWLASDVRWYPPSPMAGNDHPATPPETWPPPPGRSADGRSGDETWRHQRWGLGDFWWGILVYLAASIAIGLVVVAAKGIEDPAADIELNAWEVSATLLGNFAAFIGIPLIASYRKGQRSLRADFGLSFRWIDIPIGIGGALVAIIGGGLLGVGLDELLNAPEETSNLPIEDVSGWAQFIVILLGVGIITPVAEELFFRGLLLRGLLRRYSVPAALVVSGAVFMALHLAAVPEWPGVAVLAAVITVYSVVLVALCYWTKLRLGAPIIAHALINSFAVFVSYWPG